MKHKLPFAFGIILAVWAGVNLAVAAGPTALLAQPFILQDKLTASDKASYAEFGAALALSKDGQIMVVGGPLHDVEGNSNQGQVYVFRRNGNTWTEAQKLVASDGQANDHFGESVAIADAPDYTIIVGSPDHNTGGHTDLGAAYVFAYGGSTWSQQTKLTITDANEFSYDRRGSSVAISANGNTAFVGAPGVGGAGGTEPGAVYAFARSGDTWSQTQKIEGPAPGAAGLGRSMTLSGNGGFLLVAGLYSPAGPVIGDGIVRIYQKSGGVWTEIDSLIPSDGDEFDEFGASIATIDDGSTILVGAPNNQSGKAYVFTKSGLTWAEQSILTRPSGSTYGKFGESVALDSTSTKAAIGAWLNGSGAIHRIEKEGASWNHVQTLVTPDDRQEHLGFAVGMSSDGELIAGGARGAHSSTEVYDEVGAVYVFVPGFQVFLPLVTR